MNGVVEVDGVTNEVTMDQEDKAEGTNAYQSCTFFFSLGKFCVA